MKRVKKTCKNCGTLKALHKIGRDCDARVDNRPTCNWTNGHCRNNLNVEVTG